MDMAALEQALQTKDIGTVVATLGTTAVGAVDPLPQIIELQKKYNFRIHVDSAYGGYFTLANNLAPATRAAYDAIPQADSIVVDPHKHGLQPYGCGAILFADPSLQRVYRHDSPFTDSAEAELHLGEISLECSRAGAAAAALWLTLRALDLAPILAAGVRAASAWAELIEASDVLELYRRPELDILCFHSLSSWRYFAVTLLLWLTI